MVQLSEKARKLLQEPNYLYLATLNRDSSPQVTPVWVDIEDDRVLVNTAVGRVKERNARRDPRIAASIAARDNPWDKVDIRGRVVEFIEGERAENHIDFLAKKYIGEDLYPWRRAEERRVILVIEADRIHEM